MQTQQLNIIITGKSGVGKSSFLNYLCGKECFATGDGNPITQNYFQKDCYNAPNGISYCLYDTKGIEPNTTEECKKQIFDKIDECDKKTDIFEWIHTIYYCFAAPSKRIEQFEIDFIKQLQTKASVTILITKKDLVTDNAITQIKQQIVDDIGGKIQIISVCSVSITTRKGISQPSGRESVLRSGFIGLWNKLSKVRCKKITSMIDIPIDWDTIESNLQQLNIQKSDITFAEIRRKYDKLTILQYLKLISISPQWDTFILPKLLQLLYTVIKNFEPATIIRSNFEIYARIFAFYQKLNGFFPDIMYSHSSNEELSNIKNINLETQFNKINNLAEELYKAKQDVDDTFIFDSKEKQILTQKHEEYINAVQQTASKIKNLLDNYEKVYQTELYQYGQDCLRNYFDTLPNTITDVTQLSRNYYYFYKIIQQLMQADKNDEYTISVVAQTLGIPTHDQEKIIAFAQKTINQ